MTNGYLVNPKPTPEKQAEMKRKFVRIINQKWLQHLIFWMLSLYAIAAYFSISNQLREIDFIYSISFHFCLVPVVYINLKWLVTKFLKPERYFLFFFFFAVNILLGLLLHELIFDFIIPEFFSGYYIVSFTDNTLLILIFGIYLLLTTLIKLSRSWLELQELHQEKVSLELSALKSQINPHFLFNGLNSIYSLSLNQDPKATEAVLKLSNMLRYVLYEVENTFVEIKAEIEMIRQYMELQSLRFPENINTSFELSGKPEGKKVAPMLFFPLLENAFKHSDLQKEGYIAVNLVINETEINFKCINKISEKDDPENKRYGGIGIQNIQSRLNLLYPGKHIFRVFEKKGHFFAEINLHGG